MLARLNRNLIYNFLLSSSQIVIPFISIPYLSKTLSTDGIGKINFIDSLTYYFLSIAEFGITVYGTKQIARVRNNPFQTKKLVSELLSLRIVSSSISLLFYIITVFFLWKKIDDIRLIMFSLSFLLINFFACDWYFIGTEQFKYISFRSMLVRMAGLISMFLLIKAPQDYYLYYGIMVGSGVIIGLWNVILLKKQVEFSFSSVHLRKHLNGTLVTYMISIFYSIPLMLDNVFLGLVSAMGSVGVYAYSIKVLKLSTSLISDTTLVFFPRIVQLWNEENYTAFTQTVHKNIRLIIVATIPMSFGLFAIADQIPPVLFDDEYASASRNIKILCVFPLLKAMNLLMGRQLLMCFNKEKMYMWFLMASSFTYIPIALLLSYFFHDAGASIAIIVNEVFLLTLNYMYLKKNYSGIVNLDMKASLQALIASFLFFPLVYFFSYLPLGFTLSLTFSVAGCVLVYFFVMNFVLKNEVSIAIINSALSFLKRKR